MWSYNQNELSKKKVAKETLTLPPITKGQTTRHQVSTAKASLHLREDGKRKEHFSELSRSPETHEEGYKEETDSRTSSDDDVDRINVHKHPKTFLELSQKDKSTSLLDDKRFMVYICGGYKDTDTERRALMENVYPRLYLYCKQRGYDFRMVDLRQGVRSPIAECHDTVKLHVETLERCQQTPGPNFILFVGQKHEVRNLPSTISKETFEAMVRVLERVPQNTSEEDFSASASQSSITTVCSSNSFVQESIYRNFLNFGEEATNSGLLSSHSSLSDGEEASPTSLLKDLTLLHTWYKLDENFIPPVYCLLPISTHYPDILSVDGEHRKQARKVWRATCHRLWTVLQRSATEALGQEEASLLLRTVLDMEIESGLRFVHESPPEDHCHCYKRVIPDLHYNLKNQHASQYIDLLKGQARIDPELNTAYQSFMSRLHKKLRHTNIYERKVGWGRKGLDPKNNRSHQFYAERISSHFQRTVINSLNKFIKITKTPGPFDVVRREDIRVQVQEEIQRHVSYGLHLAKNCTLRKTFLADVQKAVEQSKTRKTLLVGPPGWGKSTTMAAVAQLAPSWFPGAAKVLVHFIGYTGESRNVRRVLQALCVQMVETYCPQTQLSEGLPQLINEFYTLLGLVGADRPLIVLLDGLDELSEEHGSDLSWISISLPPNIHFILSTATDSHCSHTLQHSAHPAVLFLPPINIHDIKAALEAKLQTDQRCLQEQQWELLVQACHSCPSPLYLEVAYSESLLWTSYSFHSLPDSLEGLYLSLLARLERELGRQLVRRATSLISISRWGVTEEEILDLLAKDGKVREEISSSHPDTQQRVPYILWARLKQNLGHHLTEVKTDGTWVYRWTHSKFNHVCIGHYLKTVESHMTLHADYADYYRDKSQHAHIFQPLVWTLNGEEKGEGLTKMVRFNMRKLHGLPYHLVRSGQILPFLAECVFNYEFLLQKAWGLSVLDIMEDLKKAVLPDKVLVDVDLLSGALDMSHAVLQQDPSQLASQLMGRLGQMVIEDRPVAKGDPLKFSYLHALLAQCAQSSLPVLLPSSTCLLPPGGPQHTLLAGHLTRVTALCVSQRRPLAVTSEADGSLRFWDLEHKRIIRGLDPEGGIVGDFLTLGLDDRMLIVCMGQALQVREVESGQVVYSENDSVDTPMVTTTCDGQLLVVFYNGSHKIKVFDLASSCSLLRCVSIEREVIHTGRTIVLSNNSIKDYVLFAYRSGVEASVFSARGGAVLSVLSSQHGAASIQAVDMTEDYLLLFCRYPYKRGMEIIRIELFSSCTFLYLRSILGCGQDSVSQFATNRVGSHAVAFCSSLHTGITKLVTWDLETDHHKHITHFSGVLMKGQCLDLRYCLGICHGERHLHLWDLTSSINDQTLTYNIHKPRSDGIEDVVPMGKSPRYAVCCSIRPGTVYVWNLARQRFVCRPVRVEHGLYSSTDVVLAHDFKLYILTDRNKSTDNPSNQFQTLLVYDLINRKYVRRQSGLAVIRSLKQEYCLLKDGRTLLGLSETRDHLILWDLDSGSIKGSIKPKMCRSAVQDLQGYKTPQKETTLMPWDLRTESQSDKKRRLEKEAQREKEEQMRLDREKFSSIDQYLISEDEQVVVCSYLAHHLNVFSVASHDHIHTLEDKTSMLSLHTAALTHTGGHLVLTNYNEAQRMAYITLWDLRKGMVKKRLRNEPAVCCMAVTDDADRIAFGVTGENRLKVWEPFKRYYKSIDGYGTLRIDPSSKLYMTDRGTKAILLSGQLSLWDLEMCSVLSVLTLDAHVHCTKLLGGQEASILLGLSHRPALITVKPTSNKTLIPGRQASKDRDLFGESSSSEEES